MVCLPLATKSIGVAAEAGALTTQPLLELAAPISLRTDPGGRPLPDRIVGRLSARPGCRASGRELQLKALPVPEQPCGHWKAVASRIRDRLPGEFGQRTLSSAVAARQQDGRCNHPGGSQHGPIRLRHDTDGHPDACREWLLADRPARSDMLDELRALRSGQLGGPNACRRKDEGHEGGENACHAAPGHVTSGCGRTARRLWRSRGEPLKCVQPP